MTRPRGISVGMLLVALFAWQGCAHRMPPGTARELNQFLGAQFLYDIDVKGTVVAKDGEPLHGVRVTRILHKKGEHRTQQVIDESFHVKEDDWHVC